MANSNGTRFNEKRRLLRPSQWGRRHLVALISLLIPVLSLAFFLSTPARDEAPPPAAPPGEGNLVELLAQTRQEAMGRPRPLIELAQFGEGTIHALHVSPDGQTIIVIGPAGVKPYDSRTLAPAEPYSNAPTTGADWLENGRFLAWAARSNGRSVVDIRTVDGAAHSQLRTDSFNEIRHLAASPDGQQLALLLGNNTLQLWSASAGVMRDQWSFEEERPGFFAWSPSGRQIALPTRDQTIHLISSKTGATEQILRGSRFNLAAATWSPDGHYLAALSNNSQLLVWEAANGRLALDESGVSAIAWATNGRFLTGSRHDGRLSFWKAAAQPTGFSQTPETWQLSETAGLGLRWLADPPRLLSWDDAGSLRLHDEANGRLLAERHNFHTASFNAISDLAWSPNGRYLAASSWDRVVRIWEVETGSVSRVLSGHRTYVGVVDWSPTGQWLASGSLDSGGALRLWSAETDETHVLTYEDDSPVASLAFSPDGRWLAVGLRSGLLGVQPIPPTNDAPLLSGRPFDDDITSLVWSPDNGRLLALGHTDQAILWKIPEGTQEKSWTTGATGSAFTGLQAAWSPWEPLLALAATGEIALWNSDTWQIERRLPWRAYGSPDQVAFSNNGRWLALVDGQQPVTIFETATGAILYEGVGHGGTVRTVAWSPTTPHHLATGGDDGIIRLWLLPDGETGR